MPIELKMPALSPTMEEGTLAKWLVKEGDKVKSGDMLAEIETDKATMEFEAVDEGTIAKILVAEGSDGVKVGTPIALMAGEGEERRSGARTPKADATPKKEEPKPAEARATCPRQQGRRRNARRAAPQPAPAPEGRHRRPHQGQPARPPPRRSAGHRPRRR